MAVADGEQLLSLEEVAGLRVDYVNTEFSETDLKVKNPMHLFDAWFKEAKGRDDVPEPNAMTLSTCGRDMRPLARVVLLKGYDERGFRFFTNYESRKGKAIQENGNVALSFFWEPLHRQVIVQGTAEKLKEEESAEYFHSRPRSSQIGAIVSNQSTVIAGRHVLRAKENELKQLYQDESVAIPKPDYWGGYVVRPTVVEFWSGRQSRLHDRILFRLRGEGADSHAHEGSDGWVYERLSP